MKKKSVKKKVGKNSSRSSEKRDQYTVVLEDIRSQNQAIAEIVSGINDKFDEHREDFEHLRAEVELLRADVELLRADVESLKADVELLRADVESLKADVELIKGELALIRHNLITREEFKLLETRVARLERSRHRR